VRLFHTTPRVNQWSIQQHGLLTRYSQGKRPLVWLHTAERTAWAFLHCVRRHGCRVEDVITFEVEIADELVKRSPVDSLFYVDFDIDPCCFYGVRGFQVVSESPLKGW
jgi:hypothetical protein